MFIMKRSINTRGFKNSKFFLEVSIYFNNISPIINYFILFVNIKFNLFIIHSYLATGELFMFFCPNFRTAHRVFLGRPTYSDLTVQYG